MKRINRVFVTVLLLAILTAAVMSCKEPSPLFGSWADNFGNSFSFFDDGNFNAKVARTGLPADVIDGTYVLLLNVITFDGKGSSGNEFRVNSEWDIRGNILYLHWTETSGSKALSLYKTSN